MNATRLLMALCCGLLLGCADNDKADRAERDAEPGVPVAVADTGSNDNAAEPAALVRGQNDDVTPVSRDSGNQSLAYPTGDRASSVMLVEANAPREMPVGKQYQFQIKLTNLTDHLALENIKLYYNAHESIEFFDVSSEGASSQSKPQADKSAESKQASQQEESANRQLWKVDRLAPGQTAAIQVKALGHKEGSLGSCLAVQYQPVLCLATTYVKPELELAKAVPERASLCDQIVFRYTIKNSGSGAAKDLTLSDPLPDGFKTTEGAEEAKFSIETLAPGGSREFDVRVVASEAGEFASRASLKSAGGIEVQSERPTTTIAEADLAIEASGPDRQLAGKPFLYEVEVTNRGKATAKDAVLTGELSPEFRALEASDPFEKVEALLTWRLGELDAGASKKLWIRLVSTKAGSVTHTFRAGSQCARTRDLELAKAELTTEILSLPALALAVADRVDPVPVGQSVHYNVTVMNEGTSPAKNIEVAVELPEELKYVQTDGAEAQADGQRVTFKKIDELAPGEVAQWSLETKAQSEGLVKLQAELKSDRLKEPAISMEPTRLYSKESAKASSEGN